MPQVTSPMHVHTRTAQMPISAEQWRVSVGLVDASRSLRPRVTCQPKTNLTWTCLLTALLVAVLLTGNGLRGTGSGSEYWNMSCIVMVYYDGSWGQQLENFPIADKLVISCI